MNFLRYKASEYHKDHGGLWMIYLLPGLSDIFRRLRNLQAAILLLIFYTSAMPMIVHAQSITLTRSQAPLKEVLDEIGKQSGYKLLYNNKHLEQTKPVTLRLKAEPLKAALEACMTGQPVTYEIINKTILIRPRQTEAKEKVTTPAKGSKIGGKVVNEQGEPLAGATVRIKGTGTVAITDREGRFWFDDAWKDKSLIVAFIGYESQESVLRSQVNITMLRSESTLDEAQVIAYGTTTKRLNTGSVSSVKAADIQNQPVMNPLAALSGRIPGMTVVQNSGLPGGNFSINVRGRTSINNNISNDPLFIIDGVPFANNNNDLGNLSTVYPQNSGGLSPFNTINPSDIESIEVLKDADATSIYGSRGANGVVLITTKKGKEGKTSLNANVYTGANRVTRTMSMMDTRQYIAMRKEALANDGVTANLTNAYDLVAYDTTRYTDWKKYFIGNAAHTFDGTLTLSGGSKETQFLLTGGYHRETTVFPGNLSDSRYTARVNVDHKSSNEKFKVRFSGSYGGDRNHMSGSDLTQFTFLLPPNTAPLIDGNGKLTWEENGGPIDNPLAYLYRKYNANTDNYLANLQLSYEIAKGFYLKNSFGFNSIYVDELSTNPIAAQNPVYSPMGGASFSNSRYQSLIVEPQLQYSRIIGPGKLEALLGGTWQRNNKTNQYIEAYGYNSDQLLESLSAAGSVTYKSSSNSTYKYAAAFARINYNITNKYILNLTGRRDGSSRFGPQNRYSAFGAIGAAWVFSEEQLFKDHFGIFSFGKLRGSYGSTGNDKIGDYNYLDTWTALSQTYLGQGGLYPTRLFNGNYRWEVNKKLEIALDLGFFNDRILFTANWYRNRSGNQLIPFTYPIQTGGNSIIANFPANVQNMGWEFVLNTTNVKGRDFEWNSTLNISIPRNKLLSFPNLETSTYKTLLVVGKPLNIVNGFLVNGVDPQTGVYRFVAEDGSLTSDPKSNDFRMGIKDVNPVFFGGLGNNFRYKGFGLDLFFDFRKQTGKNYLGNLLFRNQPGTIINMPKEVMERWTPDRAQTYLQKYTATSGAPAYIAGRSMYQNGADLFYSDASFIRLKTLSCSYTLPVVWASKIKVSMLRVYMNAQNLITFTAYKGADPESQRIFSLPPLRTLSFGLQVSL